MNKENVLTKESVRELVDENRIYLFEFKFEKMTIKSHLVDYCNEKQIDYVNGHLGGIYVDLFGEDRYYRLSTEAVGNGVFEVYADMADFIKRDPSFSRIYPLVAKALRIETPVRKVKMFFSEGNPTITDVMMPSIQVKNTLKGMLYSKNDVITRCTEVQILA